MRLPFGILFAYYIGERLIYRKSLTAPSRLSCAAGESFWALLFYVPYLLYGFAGNVIFLFWENGRKEGAVFFLVKLLAFIGLCVKLYKMPKSVGQLRLCMGQSGRSWTTVKTHGSCFFASASLVFYPDVVGAGLLRLQGFIITDIISLLETVDANLYRDMSGAREKYKD